MTTLDAIGGQAPAVPSDPARETARSLRRLRRRRRAARRRAWAIGGIAAFCILLVATVLIVQQMTRRQPAPMRVKTMMAVPIDVGGMVLRIEGTSRDALAQGFGNCVSQRVRIVCQHPDPIFAGIRASGLSLSLGGPSGMRDAEDVRKARFEGVTFHFDALGAGGLELLDTALREAGWLRPVIRGRNVYYHPDVPASVTLTPGMGHGTINAIVRSSDPAFVDAQLRLIRMQMQADSRREKEVADLIARMNGGAAPAATLPPS